MTKRFRSIEIKKVDGSNRFESESKERSNVWNKRIFGSIGLILRPWKWARIDKPHRVEAIVSVYWVPVCVFCDRRHPNDCWRKMRACFRCGSVGHRVMDYSRHSVR